LGYCGWANARYAEAWLELHHGSRLQPESPFRDPGRVQLQPLHHSGDSSYESRALPARGSVRICSLTADPKFQYFATQSFAAYLIGGGGFYRKESDVSPLQTPAVWTSTQGLLLRFRIIATQRSMRRCVTSGSIASPRLPMGYVRSKHVATMCPSHPVFAGNGKLTAKGGGQFALRQRRRKYSQISSRQPREASVLLPASEVAEPSQTSEPWALWAAQPVQP